MNSILIVGATGSVGKHLVNIMTIYGNEFYVSPNSTGYSNNLESQQFETFRNQQLVKYIEMDYNNLKSINYQKLEGIKKIFLMLPKSNILDATKRIVVEARKTNSVKHVVKLSITGTNLSPPTYEGIIHRQAEKIIAESGLYYTFLRPNYYMQNFIRVNYILSKKGNTFYLPLGNARGSFVDTRDVAEVAARILHEESDKYCDMTYDITGKQRLNCSDIARILETGLGKPINYTSISEQTAKIELIKSGISPELIEGMLDFYRIIREGRMRRISKAVETILGRHPISFETFVTDHVELFQGKLNKILKAIN